LRLIAYIVGLCMVACSQGAGITEAPADNSTSAGPAEGGDEPLGDSPTEGGEEDIVYPQFQFTGNGPVTCGGDVGMATAGVKTTIDGSQMMLQTLRANMNCTVEKCEQGQVTAKVQESIGSNHYVRVSDDELDEFADKDDFISGKFAVYASSVSYVKTSNPADKRVFTFDKPLPVFPFPGPASRFDAIKDGATWKARTSGHFTMNVTMTMKVTAANDNLVSVVSTVDIAEDTDRSLYEMFPIPRQSVYTIDPKKRRVTRIEITNWFRGDECKGKPGEVYMNYDLCQVTKGGDVEDIQGCQ
jgi:hypothetical protein